MIRQEQVDLPNSSDVECQDYQGYPPKIKLRFTPDTQPPVRSECNIQIIGLKEEYGFNIPLYVRGPSDNPSEGTDTMLL